jgi:hypothetical protein
MEKIAKGWKPVFRLLPFVYATVASTAWFWRSAESAINLLGSVLIANLIAGLFVLIAWFEMKRKW